MKLTMTLALLFALTAPIAVHAKETPAQRAAEAHAKALGDVVANYDPAAFERFIAEHFGAEMQKIPFDEHLSLFGSYWNASRGLDFLGAQSLAPNEITALFRRRLTGTPDATTFVVEPKPPYKLTDIQWAPVDLKSPLLKPRGAAGAPAPLSDQEIAAQLGALFKKMTDADSFSGAALLARDGVPVFQAAGGKASRDFGAPNTIDTRFNLGSMNKMFTAVSIMQLVEHGKLSLDDPLSKFLPTFPDAESAKKIKIKHLLSHSAGLGGYFSDRFWTTSRDQFRTVDDMIKFAAADEKLQFEPGTKFQYSNTGMLVAGKVIEVVTGASYYDYVRENIYKPAGMTRTDCYELDRVNDNLAIGYDKEYTRDGVVLRNNIFMHVMKGGPHGGGYSTVGDLLKFDRALRSGKLIRAESVKLITSIKPEFGSENYGYGFQVIEPGRIAGHSGGFPGIDSNLDMFLGTEWTAVVMSNYSNGTWPLTFKMREIVKAQAAAEVPAR